MVNKQSIELLGYSDWLYESESSKIDAVYFTVKFKDQLDLNELVIKAIERAIDSISTVCKLETAYPDKFTIVLNEEESFDIFSEVGATEPLTIQTKYSQSSVITYPNLIALISNVFSQVSSVGNKKATFILKEGDFELEDPDIVDEIVRSAPYIRKIDSIMVSRTSLESAEAFLRNEQNIEKAFLSPNKEDKTRFANELSEALRKKIVYELNVLVLESAVPFDRTSLSLAEFSERVNSIIDGFKQRAQSNSSREDIKSFISDLINFQKEMVGYNYPNDIRRRLAARAIVTTYDLFGKVGISPDEALAIVGS